MQRSDLDSWIQEIPSTYHAKITTLSEKASEVDQLKARIQALEDENEDLNRKLAIASPQ